jgi:hypothetical protein
MCSPFLKHICTYDITTKCNITLQKRLTHPGQLALKVGDMVGTLHELIATAFYEESNQSPQSDGVRLALCTAVVGLLNNTPYTTFTVYDVCSELVHSGSSLSTSTGSSTTSSTLPLKQNTTTTTNNNNNNTKGSAVLDADDDHKLMLQFALEIVNTPSFTFGAQQHRHNHSPSHRLCSGSLSKQKITSLTNSLDEKLGVFGKEFLKILSAVASIWFNDTGHI